MDLDDIFDCLVSLKCRIEGDIECERSGISSGYKIKSLREELKKVDHCIKDVQECLKL